MKGYRKSAVIFTMALFAVLVLAQRSPAAAPAGGDVSGPAKMESKSGCPCDCGCGGCGCEGCGQECGCGHKHHGDMHPMMEGMKKHMEEVHKSVASLREHEKKMEGITDPAEFRKAAIAHFRMLDDLQESHVKHMESMMGGGHGHRPQ